jgi:hypothetical protein
LIALLRLNRPRNYPVPNRRTELTRCKMRRSGDYVDSGEGWARPAGRGNAFVWLIRPRRRVPQSLRRRRCGRCRGGRSCCSCMPRRRARAGCAHGFVTAQRSGPGQAGQDEGCPAHPKTRSDGGWRRDARGPDGSGRRLLCSSAHADLEHQVHGPSPRRDEEARRVRAGARAARQAIRRARTGGFGERVARAANGSSRPAIRRRRCPSCRAQLEPSQPTMDRHRHM